MGRSPGWYIVFECSFLHEKDHPYVVKVAECKQVSSSCSDKLQVTLTETLTGKRSPAHLHGS